MTERLWIVETPETYPYRNLALEEYLLMSVPEKTQILYLWQNRNTIVVGRNQDVFRECDMEQVEEGGVRIARRLSGGGAVFHDMGNLNFTFLCRKEDRDIGRNTDIVLSALKKLGIIAERSGRNDILAGGAKISGNAFFETGGFCYHHGTLLVDTDKDLIARYLSVSKEKLRLKGVDSVKSRVTNLKDLNGDISVDNMKTSLIEAFSEKYGIVPEFLSVEQFPEREIEERTEKFSSRQWIYGKKIFCNRRKKERFDWGDVEILLYVEDDMISRAHIFSDAMDQDYILKIAEAMTGCRCDEETIRKTLMEVNDGISLPDKGKGDRIEDMMKMMTGLIERQEAADERQI